MSVPSSARASAQTEPPLMPRHNKHPNPPPLPQKETHGIAATASRRPAWKITMTGSGTKDGVLSRVSLKNPKHNAHTHPGPAPRRLEMDFHASR